MPIPGGNTQRVIVAAALKRAAAAITQTPVPPRYPCSPVDHRGAAKQALHKGRKLLCPAYGIVVGLPVPAGQVLFDHARNMSQILVLALLVF